MAVIRNVHQLKTWPQVYQAVANGEKTAEFRDNDRNFEVGDVLRLKEFKPELEDGKYTGQGRYTGREIDMLVTHILRGPIFGIPEGYVVMSIRYRKKKRRCFLWS